MNRKGKTRIYGLAAVAVFLLAALLPAAEVKGAIKESDVFLDANWTYAGETSVFQATGWLQAVCATDDYIICLENYDNSKTDPDTLIAFYKNPYDENGNPVPVCGMSMGMTSTGESGCTLHTEKNPNRGISQVTIDYGKKKDFDSRTVQKHLCQNCLDKLLEVMEVYGYVQEEPKPRELCLIDFQTMELYSLQDEKCTYYIRDYYVRIDSGEDQEITAVYAPDIEKK